MKTYLLKLRPAGMFSNVNEVVQQIYLALENQYRFLIDWSNSCYFDEARQVDPWRYYFKPVWQDAAELSSPIEILPTGASVACSKDNIITPRRFDGVCDPLLLPKNRAFPGELIQRFIILNDLTNDLLETFIASHLQQPFLGLHIRGPGRLDGGAKSLRAQSKSSGGVPLELYFNAADEILSSHPDWQVFACSDSSFVISQIKDRYGAKVVTYDATRTPFGEMHASHPENQRAKFNGFKLGLDVLLEAHILARSAHFVHGNSNVANFVLCKSPSLGHCSVLA